MTNYQTQHAAEMIGGFIMDAVATAQANAPRTLQSEARVLGMSQLGGCREFIRASIAGEPGSEEGLKWAAYVGTALGDKIETDVKDLVNRTLGGTITQRRVTLFLNVDGQDISVSGSTDIMFTSPVMPDLPPAVIDLKSRNGLGEIRREGPDFREKAQVSGYLLASIDEGLLPENAIGMLMFVDRSGSDSTYHVWAVDREQALAIMETVTERLREVASALATGRRAPRDEPESWCFHTQCPFYQSCWAGYQPTGAIEHEDELARIDRYLVARKEQKEASDRMRAARDSLQGVEGVTPDGTTITWSLQVNGTTRIDVREPKG